MSWRTLLALVVLLAALAFLWRGVQEDESRDVRDADRPLVEGVHAADVVGVRLENVLRDHVAEFRRDADGAGWSMVSPYRCPADAQLVGRLVAIPLERRGRVVPDADLAALSLAPPRQELRLRLADGGERSVRVGAADLDGQRVYVQSGDAVLLVLRDIETACDRMLDEYLSRNLANLDARQVVELHRRGSWPREGGAEDLALDAAADGGAWRIVAPWKVRADPGALLLLVQLGSGLRLDTFHDLGAKPRAALGLDPAEFTLSCATLQEERATLSFGRAGEPRAGRLYAGSDRMPFVGAVDDAVVDLATTPALEFADLRLHRFLREQVDLVRLERDGTRVELRRGPAGWSVLEGRASEGFAATPLPAEGAEVRRLLARLEELAASSFRPGLELGSSAGGEGLWVGARGALAGGRFGADYSEPGTAPLARFLRDDEDLVALVDPAWKSLVRQDAGAFRSLSILEIDEVRLVRLRFAAEGRAKDYVRGKRGVWSLDGASIEALELRPLLDPLFFLRAKRHLGPAQDSVPLRAAVEVRYDTADGPEATIVVGLAQLDGAETTLVEHAGARSIARDQGLHAKLLALLGS